MSLKYKSITIIILPLEKHGRNNAAKNTYSLRELNLNGMNRNLSYLLRRNSLLFSFDFIQYFLFRKYLFEI